jgi:putative SOS response-associated peptidase YedK
MCGRFAFHSPLENVLGLFGVERAVAAPAPRWNITPGTDIPVVRRAADGRRECVLLHWGLVPSWARERSIGSRLVNARAETLAEKPAFRSAFRRRRCLVVADGYYEWQTTATGKQPWYLRASDEQPFGIAALWEAWSDPAAGTLESCVIVTREATGIAHDIHGRMPVLIARDAYADWLAPPAPGGADPARLLDADPAVALIAHRVGRRVNNPRNEGSELVVPAAAGAS